jgi:hypothetical protein
MPIQETNLLISGIRIDEPVTVLTNLILSVFSFYFYARLGKLKNNGTNLSRYWRLFFLFIAIANTIAAFAHGFKSYFTQHDYYYIWMFMNMAGIPASYYLLLTNLESAAITQKTKNYLQYLAAALTLSLVIFIYLINDISLVKVNAGLVIFITLFAHLIFYRKGIPGSKLILRGFIISILTLFVHTLRLSLHDYFNYKDLSHVIMNIGLYVIFLGVVEVFLEVEASDELSSEENV